MNPPPIKRGGDTRSPIKRAPGGGRKPKPEGTDVPLKVYLPADLLEFAKAQGGSQFVRSLIQQAFQQSRTDL